MKKIYFKDANGNKVSVVVKDEIAQLFHELRREEWRGNAYEKYHTISLDAIVEAGHEYVAEEPDAETELIRREEGIVHTERLKKLKTALSLLTPLQRRTLKKLYILKMTQAEIAREENVSRAAIKIRLDDILAKLKKQIEKK